MAVRQPWRATTTTNHDLSTENAELRAALATARATIDALAECYMCENFDGEKAAARILRKWNEVCKTPAVRRALEEV